MQMEQAQFIPYGGGDSTAARSDAIRKLEGHQLDFIVDFNTQEFAINEKSTKGRLLRTLFLAQQATASQATTPSPFKELVVSGNPIRYVDWLVPGVIGMNFMFSSLFGVGYVIVRYRKNGVLKRFKATPVHTLNFVAAQAASRLVIVLLTAIFVFTATNLILHFRMLGSYFNLLIVASLAILAMISLGLVFASRIRSEELAGGLINLVTLPMMGLSGIFFLRR
ncbi:hypothetical protein MASR2M78_30420 [Treponema sp.]